MIAALALLGAGVAGGTVATWLFAPRLAGYARVAWGTFIGWTLLAFGGFISASIVGMGAATLLVAAGVSLLPALALARPGVRGRIVADAEGGRRGAGQVIGRLAHGLVAGGITPGDLVKTAYVAGVGLVLWFVAARTFFAEPGGLSIGNVNNLGDLPYHVSITAGFAFGDNFPPGNPVYAGSGLSYHYMSDFLAALPIVAGASLVQAWFLITVGLLLALAATLHRWARELTGSVGAARLVPLIVLGSGGLGWVTLVDQAKASGTSVVAAYLAGDARYTIGDADGLYRFGNAITTLLIPQRGLLLGFGLAVIVFTLLWRQVDTRMAAAPAPAAGLAARLRPLTSIPGWQRVLVAGLLTGVLPIVHIHSWAVVFGTAFLLGVVFRQWREARWRAWVVYVLAAVALSVPALLWTARGSQASFTAFLDIKPGWDSGDHNLLVFWAANAGVFIALLVVAYLADRETRLLGRKLFAYSAVFLFWFVLANVLRLAPWIWDNIKVLLFWWLGGAPVVALLLTRLWQERGAAGRAGAAVLLVIVTLSGALDIGRATLGPRTFREWDADAVAFAARIRAETPSGAVILADPTYNSPVLLAGRPVYMGYSGWLFANGLPYAQREQDVRTMYTGGAGAEDLLLRAGIGYIVVGPQERAEVKPSDQFLARFPVVVEVGAYRLLQVSQ